MLTPTGQPGAVSFEQYLVSPGLLYASKFLCIKLSCFCFFFVSCKFMTSYGDCFEQLDHADTHRVILGVAKGLVLEYNLSYSNLYCFQNRNGARNKLVLKKQKFSLT